MNITDFKNQINPSWRYNLYSPDLELLHDGQSMPLTPGIIDGILEDHPDLDALTILVFAPNGKRETVDGVEKQKYRQKDRFTVDLESNDMDMEDEEEEVDEIKNQKEFSPYKGEIPTRQSSGEGLSGLNAVFANPATSNFLYSKLDQEKNELKAEKARLESELKAEQAKIRKYELAELDHKQELREKDRLIKEKEDEVKAAKGWSDKANTLLKLAQENPEGATTMMNGIVSSLKQNFGGTKGLTGPNDQQLSEIIQWYKALPNEEAKTLVFQVIMGLAQSGDQFFENAQNVIELLPTNQNAHAEAS